MRSTSNRDYVIKVVSEMFLLRGFACTSMDDVVKQSGVSKSNIYYHFKSKDELTLAVLESYISTLQNLFREQSQAEDGQLLPRLEHYIEQLIQDLAERDCVGGCPLMSLMVEAGKTNEAVRVRLAQFFQQQKDQLTQLLEEGKRRGEVRNDLPASVLASLISSWLEGMLMLASIQKSASTLRGERDALLSMLKARP
ncbi:TetR family transcriptional regulator [Reticulibacter mediterranei]|uniref:TetR family transcriptional regulator n=1 Tax=Reticulibacter mediterranei TaxID=2778369 RepID=A0A8J3IRP1_9CHLR|nr:TetR/AcrR family transcriptional regulator [Reticulibacter mediterranei]GHO94116.1 TetR family transcriptional regulator [Reticulibacter mediterranei]